MAEVPFELRYTLNRRQRLIPHLKLWGPLTVLIPLVLAGLLAGVARTPWAGLLALGWVLIFRNFVWGFVDVVCRATVPMDLQVEENGLGFLAGGERWWLFLDGLIRIEQLTEGVWTLQHHNGSVVNVPAETITEPQLAHLRAAMERGRTPEGVQAVIERGRRLVELGPGEQGGGVEVLPIPAAAPSGCCDALPVPAESRTAAGEHPPGEAAT